MIEQMGLTGARPLKIPGVKEERKDKSEIDEEIHQITTGGQEHFKFENTMDARNRLSSPRVESEGRRILCHQKLFAI